MSEFAREIKGPETNGLSRQDALDHARPFHAAETRVETLELHREARVLDAEQPEDGRVQIVDVDDVLDGGVAQFVRRAVADAALDTAAGEQMLKPAL